MFRFTDTFCNILFKINKRVLLKINELFMILKIISGVHCRLSNYFSSGQHIFTNYFFYLYLPGKERVRLLYFPLRYVIRDFLTSDYDCSSRMLLEFELFSLVAFFIPSSFLGDLFRVFEEVIEWTNPQSSFNI